MGKVGGIPLASVDDSLRPAGGLGCLNPPAIGLEIGLWGRGFRHRRMGTNTDSAKLADCGGLIFYCILPSNGRCNITVGEQKKFGEEWPA